MGQIFADGHQIDEALRSAVREVIRKHQKHNAPVVIWRDGRTAWVSAQELQELMATAQPRKTLKANRPSKRGR